LAASLLFRAAGEDSAELRKEISALNLELLLREAPGKSVERHRHLERVDGLALGRLPSAASDLLLDAVLGVAGVPRGVVAALPLPLALLVAADVLPVTDARVRVEPVTADRAGPRA